MQATIVSTAEVTVLEQIFEIDVRISFRQGEEQTEAERDWRSHTHSARRKQ